MFKFFSTLVFFLIFCSSVFSQEFRFVGGIGANFSRGDLDGLNFVLNRYNQTRQGQTGAAKITRPMQDINALVGIGWQLGINIEFSNDFIMAAGLNRVGRRGSTFAEGTDINNSTVRRDVRYTANTYNFDFGLGKVLDGGYLLFGASVDFYNAKAYTRVNNNDYENVMTDLGLGASFFADLTFFLSDNVAIGLKPYYQFGLLKNDFSDLNQAINPATYTNDDFEDLQSLPNNIGVQLQLRFHVSSD